MIITLTEQELQKADSLAHARNDPKVHLNKYSWQKAGVTSFENHLFGLKCEIAVAKILGIEIDESIHGGDKQNPDLYYNGLGIEVKGRTRRGWDFALLKDDIKQFKSDIGVLCWPGRKPNEIEVVGYLTKNRFKEVAQIKNYRYGNRLVAEPNHFSPLSKEALNNENTNEKN